MSEKRKEVDDDAEQLAAMMLKRRRATAVSSVAAPTTTTTTTSASTAADKSIASQTFESNLRFIEQSAAARKPKSVDDATIQKARLTSAVSSSTVGFATTTGAMSAGGAGGVGDDRSAAAVVRTAAGSTWVDHKLAEFNPEFCIFVGDLGNDCTDELLKQAFAKYPSFAGARIVKDAYTQKTKGYGFVTFHDAKDFLAAMREMNGKYIGNKPCKLRKSTVDKRTDVKATKQLHRQRNH